MQKPLHFTLRAYHKHRTGTAVLGFPVVGGVHKQGAKADPAQHVTQGIKV
jgi:hypothetical protein